MDRSRLISILLLGSFAAVVSTVVHQIGTTMVLWENKISLIPMIGPVFPFDYTVAPILVMLTYQYTDTWLKFYKGTLISGAVYCFGILPMFQAIGASQLHHNWSFAVLFIAYTACSLAVRYIILSLIRIMNSYQGQSIRSDIFRPVVQPSAKPIPNPRDGQE
ncbi:MAG: hypothetical protein HPY50_22240 [Firmicutes bacterium]|nr:hypothetical protein [Bacillota bacterium]